MNNSVLAVGTAFLSVLSVFSSRATAHAQSDPLRESEVIRLARNIPASRAAAASARMAFARANATSMHPNPSVRWERESLPGVAGGPEETEDQLFVSVPINLSSRRTDRATVAESVALQEQANAQLRTAEQTGLALELFYSAIAFQESLAAQDRALERFVEAARVVARRQEEGAASGYHQLRVELELELFRSRRAMLQTRLSEIRASLAVLLSTDPSRPLVGSLSTSPDQSKSASDRAALKTMRAAEERARDADTSNALGWLPIITLAAGPRWGSGTQDRMGYGAAASLTLPIFQRGQAVSALARAQLEQAKASEQQLENDTQASLQRARLRWRTLHAESQRFEKETHDRVQRLGRAAESGYREGQRTLLELIDSRRAITDVELRLIQLKLEAKLGEVGARSAVGEFEESK